MDKRREKCITRFWNLKHLLDEDKPSSYIFGELQQTTKCDEFYDFKEVRKTAFKNIDKEIITKLQSNKPTNEEEDKKLSVEKYRLFTYLENEANSCLSKTDPFKYYWESNDLYLTATCLLVGEKLVKGFIWSIKFFKK